MPYTLSALLLTPALAEHAGAQARGEAPIAPGATIGPVTNARTLSVLGIASLPDESGSLVRQSELWLGATQPVGHVGRVNFAALGSGNWHIRDAAGSSTEAQGILTLRARTRVGEQRIWSAVSYGYAGSNGNPAAGLLGNASGMQAAGGMDQRGSDTTVSRRIDIGQIGRAEGGVVSSLGGVELAVGMAFERATRVITQTITVDEPGPLASTPEDGSRMLSTRSLRTMQRRDLATAMASMGFSTGSTTWLLSITTPVAAWISADELAPTPEPIPAAASLAVVQPVTGWLSLVGAAATNATTVGPNMIRDVVRTTGEGRGYRSFRPVVALGIRIARLPGRGHDGAPNGILAFETRTLGAVDSMSLEHRRLERDDSETDTLRVVLLIDAPHAESVELMGDATSWVVTQMQRHSNGRWRAELRLTPGMHRIIVRSDGGKWIAPPGLPVGNDDYGTPAGMILIHPPRQ